MIIKNMICPTEEEILSNKTTGKIYVADFSNNTGKYIDISEYSDQIDSDTDMNIKISPKINVRVTYITSNDRVSGIKISKLFNNNILETLTLSNLDIEGMIQILQTMSGVDIKSIANKSIILDESIIDDSEKLKSFLNLVIADPNGKEKISEVVENYGLLRVGEINQLSKRKKAVSLFEKILDSEEEFVKLKEEWGMGKNEEVWQKFFSENSWILGSDFIEILDERRIDVENITDYLIKSYDGFVDIIELKLPTADFWTGENMPTAVLTKATMQCNRYILEAERRMNDAKLLSELKNISIVKPRITLIYGRSKDWDDEKKEAYRVLNSGYSTLNIITFDYLLERAKRITSAS